MDPQEMIRSVDHERQRGIALFEGAASIDELDAAQVEVMGRRSPFNTIQKGLGALEPGDRKRVGQAANEAREALLASLAARRETLERLAEDALLEGDRLDMSLPGRMPKVGSFHPLTIVER